MLNVGAGRSQQLWRDYTTATADVRATSMAGGGSGQENSKGASIAGNGAGRVISLGHDSV
jgi:hypothetical protein